MACAEEVATGPVEIAVIHHGERPAGMWAGVDVTEDAPLTMDDESRKLGFPVPEPEAASTRICDLGKITELQARRRARWVFPQGLAAVPMLARIGLISTLSKSPAFT